MRAKEQKTHVFRRTQTLVGLMCWFAAKETRSPFLARFASSANRPIVRRSHELNSARPSSRVRRSLRATFSAIWPSPRSRRRSRSEEHTSELQSQSNLVCRLLLEKKKKAHTAHT